MTREEIENIPKLVDFMLDKCVLADSRTKVCERLKEVCNLAIKTVEQEPCEDWYDLPSDEMTLEQARQAVKDLRKKLSEHLEQEPCEDANANQHNPNALNDVGQHKNALEEDAISRQAVLELIADYDLSMGQVVRGIHSLPSVTPKPCEDAISRQAVIDGLVSIAKAKAKSDAQKSLMGRIMFFTERLPSVNPQPKTGHCKDCKYFEYDSCAKVDGIPLILAHEICKRWGDGCKTWEDGYCFLFEPQESEE